MLIATEIAGSGLEVIRMLKKLICVGFLFVLVGCKAEIVETKVKTSDLNKSISGKVVSVPFSAVLSVLGDDAKVRAQVKSYEGIIEKYVDVEDFEISKSMMGMEIKVTGNLPLVSGDKTKLDGNDPWVLRIRKTANRTLQTPYPYRMALETTNHFASFKSEFSKLNMFMSPDPLQPLLLKIRNRDKLKLRVFTGSVEIQGKHHSIYEGEVAKRISLKMKGGVYKHTEPLIFFNIQ